MGGGGHIVSAPTKQEGASRGCMKDLQAMRGLFPEFDKDIDCPQWLAEEQEYLSSLQHEPKE